MLIRPSLVLSGRFFRQTTREFIRASSIPLVELDFVRSLAQAREQICRSASSLAARRKPAVRVAELDAAIARLRAAGASQRLRILPLARRGWSPGPDSLVSDILATAASPMPQPTPASAAAASCRSKPSSSCGPMRSSCRTPVIWPRIRVARCCCIRPFRRCFPRNAASSLPEALTVCGGPLLIDAMDRLAARIEGLAPRLASRP